jgi:hypothetical protein
MTIKGISDSHLQYFISGNFKLDQYNPSFDIDYKDVSKRYACAQELLKENPELFDGVLTKILNLILYVFSEAKWSKNLFNNHIASLAQKAVDSRPAEETDDEQEDSEPCSSRIDSRVVTPQSFAYEAPKLHFGPPPFPNYYCPDLEEEIQLPRKDMGQEIVFRAPPFLNLPDTIFPNFPSGKEIEVH